MNRECFERDSSLGSGADPSDGEPHKRKITMGSDNIDIESGSPHSPPKGSGTAEGLSRGLSERHIAMITLGGVMGSGLFIGSGSALNTAGPGGLFVAYAVVAIMVYLTMTSLGEIATFLPVVGSFNAYGSRFVDPAFGFALSWNYWFNWVTTVAYECVAIGVIMQFWLPNVHFAVWSVLLMLIIFVINSITVRGYGETEFWLALVKILAVCAFIIVGIVVAAGGLGGHKYGFELWRYKEGPFVGGFGGVLNTFIQAGFSMQGSELIGVTAAELRNPSKSIPRSTRQIFFRMLIFFVLTMFIMGLVIHYDDPKLLSGESDSGATSPFTILFEKAGIKPAAHIMNAVLIFSGISACSSGLYAACRTAHLMATQEQAPKILGRTTRRGVPIFALLFCMLGTVVLWSLNFIGQGVVIDFLSGLSGVAGFIAWAAICVIHIRFRMALKRQGYDAKDLKYRAFGYPFGPAFCFVLILVVVFGQAYPAFQYGFDAVTFFSSFLELPVFMLFWICWKYFKKTKMVSLDEVDLVTGARGGMTQEEEDAMLEDDGERRGLKGKIINFFAHICG